jgi:hypothetical protein
MELSEASQNARAALDIVKQSLLSAGRGMNATTGSGGIPAVGTCYAAALTDQNKCNDLQAVNPGTSTTLSDRVRLVGITPGTTFSRATTWSGSNKLVVTDTTPSSRAPLVINDLAVISGQCADTSGSVYNGVVQITAVSTTAPTTTYTFNPSVTGYPPFGCNTVNNGFAFGRANIVEFYIDRSMTNPDKSVGASAQVPRLLMMVNRFGRDPITNQMPVEQVVAYDIESLQVRYGLDCGKVPAGNVCATATSPTADDIIDLIATGQQWCNDMQTANCNTGLAVLDNQQRVMAAQVAVVPRTRDVSRRVLNNEQKVTTGAALNVFGATVPGDAYKHWVYRATVALRNNQLVTTTP